MTEMILEYLKLEADKEVARKTKAKERDILGYICDSYYRGLKKRIRYVGGRRV